MAVEPIGTELLDVEEWFRLPRHQREVLERWRDLAGIPHDDWAHGFLITRCERCYHLHQYEHPYRVVAGELMTCVLAVPIEQCPPWPFEADGAP